MTFDIGLHEVCAQVGRRAGVRYVITKFSRMDSLPNFLTHGALLRARELRYKNQIIIVVLFFIVNISTFINFLKKLKPIPSTVPGYLKAFFLAYTSQKVDNIHPET